MGLDDDAVKPKEHAAADARAHLSAQRCQGLTGEDEADARHEAVAHRVPQILGELSRSALGRLERDIAGEALRDEDVDDPLAKIVALDKAVVAQVGQVGLPQYPPRRLDLLDAFDLFRSDIEKTDRR